MRCCYEDIKKKTPRVTPDTKGRLAIVAIDYADVRDFASAGVLTEKDGEYIWRQHTWICEQSPFLDSIKFPVKNNFGLPEFQDYESVRGPVIPPDEIVKWCIERMKEYVVMKITMDTYRYIMFKQIFETYGIQEEDKTESIRTTPVATKDCICMRVIAPEVEKLFQKER